MTVEQTIIEPFLAQVDSILGTGYSAVLYGSAVRGEHRAGLSDVNLMLVTGALKSDTLRNLAPAFSDWVANEIPPPLILTRAEWQRASDVFPIEIADMKTAYRILRGDDPVAPLQVAPSDLRSALEREFRGKLHRLRQGFIPSAERPEDLGLLARQSIGSVAALCRGLLTLVGQPVPGSMPEVLVAAGKAAGFNAASLVEIARHRGEQGWRSSREAFEDYLAAVERTVSFVDTFQPGA